MQSPADWGRRRRRFLRKHGVHILVAFCAAAAVALVAFVMYVLTSINWRPRS